MNQEKIWSFYQTEGIDAFSGNHGRLEFLARRLSAGEKVLNIGAGNAFLEALAQTGGVDIHTLDPDEETITGIRRRLGLGDKAQVGYSNAIPFPDGFFDKLVMSEVLEHLDDQTLEATLGEVLRVLREGGTFIGTVPARESLFDSLVVCPSCGEKFHRWGHQQSFDIPRLASVLQQEGFRVETAEEIFFIDWQGVGVKKKLAGLIKQFLSWRGIGTYGTNRNIWFIAHKP
ncbi:MAG: class I SAM-dependent methyltransferase [Zoogloeaceae bacterium]|jgi:SAM-dependent methyltransferase|nr:class I SAM-dependent methyltransferase [Zoogloeaceae bacterium]